MELHTAWQLFIEKTPYIGAMLVIVFVFVRVVVRLTDQAAKAFETYREDVSKRDSMFFAALREREDSLKLIGDECHRQARANLEETHKVIRENSEVLRDNIGVLARLREYMERR